MADRSLDEIISAIQAEGLGWTARANELTALPMEEKRQRLGVLVTPEEMQRLTAETRLRAAAEAQTRQALLVGAPASIDWRNVGGQSYVTPIKNQGGCGSCVSFCTCSVIESAVRINLHNPGYSIDLSEGFCQFCGGGSCDGWGLTSGLSFAQSTGVTDEACMPYQATNMNCASSRCSDWQNRLTKISSFTAYSTMDARKNAIATIGPVLAGMEVWDDFFAYGGGAPYVKAASAHRLSPPGYHCLSVIGYDDSAQCWIVKNSWGTTWGDAGFGRIGYGQADILIDTSWSFYSVAMNVQPVWTGNIAVTQVFTTRDSQNAWAYLQGLGWRKIQTGAADGITNMLALFADAVANGRPVTVYADGNFVYQAYLL